MQFIEQLFIEVVREFKLLITISRYVTKCEHQQFQICKIIIKPKQTFKWLASKGD